jgi:hypothetical protein
LEDKTVFSSIYVLKYYSLPLGGQKRHEGVDLMKKVLNKSFSTISKTP